MTKILVIYDEVGDAPIKCYLASYITSPPDTMIQGLNDLNGKYVNGDELSEEEMNFITDFQVSLKDERIWKRLNLNEVPPCRPDYIFVTGFFL